MCTEKILYQPNEGIFSPLVKRNREEKMTLLLVH